MRARRIPAKGVAAVTALLVVALAASTATYLLAQQSAMLGQASLIASRAQAEQYARAGLDWSRGILAQDPRNADTLEDAWARPIAALPVERAMVSGQIQDEQAKYNLNNLLLGTGKSDPDLVIFRRLLEALDLPPDLAFAILDWIDPDSDLAGLAGAEDGHYLALARPYRAANQLLAQVDELHRIRGFTPERVARLRPFVTALPRRTPVNVNTAGVEVLSAIVPEHSRDDLAAVLAARRAKPLLSREDLVARLPKADLGAVANDLDWKSAFFLARVAVAQDRIELASEALLRREANGSTAIIWRRPLY